MRKLIYLLLSFVLCLGGTVNVFAAEKTVSSFADVDPNAYYNESVSYINKTGLMTGRDETHFAPEDYLQRQELAVIIGRHYTDTLNSDLNLNLSGENYYVDSINWVKKHKIMNGYADGNFGVGDYITREDFIVTLARYSESVVGYMFIPDDYGLLYKYKDYDNISDYAKFPMWWMCKTGIIKGYEINDVEVIDPQAPVTRGMAAVMLERYLQRYQQDFINDGIVFEE